MPKYCRAPNCSNTAGRLGADNRPVSFYKFPLKDGPRLQAWLRRMGREHWVPSCHQHLCSEHFTPSCFQWRWGVRYLRPDAVPSIFSRAPPAKSSRRSRSAEKPLAPPPPPAPEAAPGSPEPAGAAAGPVQVVVLAPTSASPEAAATVLLAPCPPRQAPESRRSPRGPGCGPRLGRCSGGCGGCSGATSGTRRSCGRWSSWRSSCAVTARGREGVRRACCLDPRNPKPSSSVEGLT
uniref:THAP-type domain-containing protein n=1 Tax=Castor canadensis TaxID=51338 RepID=A0A8C0WBF6_CASCN